ncbi:SigE family RNA polymerase sigma factor [Nocardioides sp.]|uniref:SigE family RNA polymerase sigma factor n=1 Tax=Nocardioides sp. TaxID=35761 RepID=UPI003D14F29C
MARSPSDAEFTAFVHGSWAGLYRTAYLLLGDRELAEDLVQTALAKTYGSWGRVRDLDRAHGYARTVLVNTATEWFRKKSWRNELATEDVSARIRETTHEPDATTRPLVLDALRTLAPRQRAVIVLRFYEDLDVAQTATALGCSEGTVKSQTSDALARLRPLLGDAVIPLSQGASHD